MTLQLAASWRPVYTASKWETVWQGMRDTITSRSKGRSAALTNAEACAFVNEWRLVASDDARAQLWWQFAAVAYGWSPERDELDASKEQAARLFPLQLTEDVWEWARQLALALDALNDGQPPRISPDREMFFNPVFLGSVRARLLDDNARATFKIPLPVCRDKKTKKLRHPLPACDKNGRGPLVGHDRRGRPIYAPCDKPGDCTPVAVDDPITVVGSHVSTLLLVLGAVWLLTRPTRRSRRD
jgi:hypothetical protein